MLVTEKSKCTKFKSDPLGQIIGILTSVIAEVYGVWNLATNYHGAYFLSFLQTSSLLLQSCRHRFKPTCARLCRRDFVLHKYLLFKSDIRKGDWRTSAICRPSCRAIAIDVAYFVVMFRPMLPGRPIYRRAYFFFWTHFRLSLSGWQRICACAVPHPLCT